jgi:hypothetical protein
MSSALTVSPRSLDLPLGALFSPTEMQIGPSTSQAEYQKLGAGLRKLDNASELWTADFSLFGLRTWGKEQGLQLAHDATGLSKFFLYKTSFVAARFAPEHRLPGYKYSAYRELMPFPPEWAYEFLARHAGEKLSSKSLRALAVKEFGSEPYKAKQPKKRNVSIRCELYARLAQHSPSQKVASFIEQILGDWIRHREGPPLTDAEKQQRYRERHPERNAEIQKRWREQQGKPAATTYHDDKQHPEASKVPVGARPEAGNDKQSTSAQPQAPVVPEAPKPDYAARRQQQIAAGAKKIEPKPERKFKLRVQWTECRPGKSYLDSENGPTQFRGKGSEHPHKFFSEADAIAAEQRHFEECGYHELVVRCEQCHCWHVRHRYSPKQAA